MKCLQSCSLELELLGAGSHYLLDDLGFILIFKKEDGETEVFISQTISQGVPLDFSAVSKFRPIGVGVNACGGGWGTDCWDSKRSGTQRGRRARIPLGWDQEFQGKGGSEKQASTCHHLE